MIVVVRATLTLLQEKKTGKEYAIKIIDTESMGPKALMSLKHEIAVMRVGLLPMVMAM